jgi:hypothetical protein
MHCGYAVVLVETRDLEKDPVTGRVVKATAVENPAHYRKAPHGSLPNWKAHGT